MIDLVEPALVKGNNIVNQIDEKQLPDDLPLDDLDLDDVDTEGDEDDDEKDEAGSNDPTDQ